MPERRKSMVVDGDAALGGNREGGAAPEKGAAVTREKLADLQAAHQRRQSVAAETADRRASIRKSVVGELGGGDAKARRGSVSVGASERRGSVTAGGAGAGAGTGAAERRRSVTTGGISSPVASPSADENWDAKEPSGGGRRRSFIGASSERGTMATDGGSGSGSGGTKSERRASVTRDGRRGSSVALSNTLDVSKRGSLATNAVGDGKGLAATNESDISKEAMKRYLAKRNEEVGSRLAESATVDPMTTRTNGLLCKLRDGHTLGVYSCVYADDGNLLASSSHDGSVCCWDISKGEIKRRYDGHTGPVFQVQWSPTGDNDRLLTAGHDGTARLWNKRSGKQLYVFRDHGNMPVMTASFCHDGSLVATAGESQTIIVYNMERVEAAGDHPDYVSGDMIIIRIGSYPGNSEGHAGSVRKVIWSKDDKFLASCSDDRTIRIWNMEDGGKLQRMLSGHLGAVNDIAFNKPCNKLVSGSSDMTVCVWLWRTGVLLHTLRGHKGVVYSVRFTPEGGGRRILSGGHDRVIHVWETGTGNVLQKMEGVHQSWVLGLDCRQDGLQFASASGDHTVGVWRALPPSWWENVNSLRQTAAYYLTGQFIVGCLNDRAAARDTEQQKAKKKGGGGGGGGSASARVAPAGGATGGAGTGASKSGSKRS